MSRVRTEGVSREQGTGHRAQGAGRRVMILTLK